MGEQMYRILRENYLLIIGVFGCELVFVVFGGKKDINYKKFAGFYQI